MEKNNWLVISTISKNNLPQSSVVMYNSDGKEIYFVTGKNTLKTKNIQFNDNVSITIPFYRNLFHKLIPAPPAEIHFKAKAQIVSKQDEKAREVLKEIIEFEEKTGTTEESIWIKVTTGRKIATYGVGVKLLDMRKPEKARNIVEIN
ncbi:MAG: pyridoxamine 5'-phosphate oxidase family protein [Candidatus Heimdallarchaeum endolithica]|uniref:Pyridoxamine 5'-phosphate oxidase family protein n=1 Tax=Candidatus Heimdallarchaeum endolithica TaxID=2876572 RepID=A0A9Y1BWE7_9ARCH|nr:MAG: pyridoxamine 5'-phosphate oxidase family protein [Candidatus Heimdallarchaeum endolithica]